MWVCNAFGNDLAKLLKIRSSATSVPEDLMHSVLKRSRPKIWSIRVLSFRLKTGIFINAASQEIDLLFVFGEKSCTNFLQTSKSFLSEVWRSSRKGLPHEESL